MEQQQNSSNAGEQENTQDMGLPEKTDEKNEQGLEYHQESLPSDGPVSQAEGSGAEDLTEGLENDNPKDIRRDAETGS